MGNQIAARRAGKQCSMYHIWPAECQIQFGAGETADNRGFCTRITAAGDGCEFGNAVRRRFPRMNQSNNVLARQRRFDLGKTGNGGPGLARERKGSESGVGKSLFDPAGQVRLKFDRSAMSAGEKPPLFCGLHVVRLGRHPNPAPREAAAEIGNDLTIGRDDKTDQRVDRRGCAGDDAGPFWLASTVRHVFLIYAGEASAPSASTVSPSVSSSG